MKKAISQGIQGGSLTLEKARKHSLLEPPEGTSCANILIFFNPVKVISRLLTSRNPSENKSMLSHLPVWNLLYQQQEIIIIPLYGYTGLLRFKMVKNLPVTKETQVQL